MLVILEAVSGPVAGRRIEVRAGTILRIGRTAKSDYALSEDSYLSGQHFAIENDGNEARARDLGSSNGTFVNGERVVSENILREGDSLTAGGSTFSIHIDAAGQPASDPSPRVATLTTDPFPGTSKISRADLGMKGEANWPGFSRAESVLLTSLYRSGETVFAVLDPVRDARIPAFLEASGERFIPLDDGIRVAAYVVQLPPTARLLDVLIKDGWSHYAVHAGGHADDVSLLGPARAPRIGAGVCGAGGSRFLRPPDAHHGGRGEGGDGGGIFAGSARGETSEPGVGVR
jgi:hypothetical protein